MCAESEPMSDGSERGHSINQSIVGHKDIKWQNKVANCPLDLWGILVSVLLDNRYDRNVSN